MWENKIENGFQNKAIQTRVIPLRASCVLLKKEFLYFLFLFVFIYESSEA